MHAHLCGLCEPFWMALIAGPLVTVHAVSAACVSLMVAIVPPCTGVLQQYVVRMAFTRRKCAVGA
jgi:hypothetical protein